MRHIYRHSQKFIYKITKVGSFLLLACILPCFAYSQVGIGTTSPNSNAILDLSSTSKGLLLPRLTASQRTSISSPPKGLLIFDLDSLYMMYYDGSTWKGVQGTSSIPNYWKRSGGATTLTHSTDSVGIGKVPAYQLDVTGAIQGDSFMSGGHTILNSKLTEVHVGARTGTVSTGGYNFFGGYAAGQHNTIGNSNAFEGYGAGYNNIDGTANNFSGYEAGFNNTSGVYDIFIGYAAGISNTTGQRNIAIGAGAGFTMSTASYNNFIGYEAGYNNTSGFVNSFDGYAAGVSNTSGAGNTFMGAYAGQTNTTSDFNTCIGYLAGQATTGQRNTMIGTSAGYANNTGQYNTFSGINTGHENTSGSYNTLYGGGANYNTTTGTGNSSLGFEAGHDNFTGSYNTNLGYRAGYHDKGTHNIFIGDSADANTFSTYNNAVAIGWSTTVSKSNSIILGNGVDVGIGTSTPAFKLDVKGSVSADTFLLGGARALYMKNASIYLGPNTGSSTMSGSYNVFAGLDAGFSTTTGHSNVGIGISAGAKYNGNWNTFLGDSADAGTSGLYNATAVGYNAKVSSSNSLVLGNSSTNIGINKSSPAYRLDVSGAINSDTLLSGGTRVLTYKNNSLLLGPNSGSSSTGANNIDIGKNTGNSNTTGYSNTAVGTSAGSSYNGSQNTFIGDSADASATGLTNATAIGYNAKVSQSNSLVLGNSNTNVGIGTSAPNAALEVDGYTMLGSSTSPAIKMIELTGTTASSQGASVSIAHGVTASKIISVNVMVAYAANSYIPPSYQGSAGYEFNWYINGSNIYIWNQSSNSGNILSKGIVVTIVYKQ